MHAESFVSTLLGAGFGAFFGYLLAVFRERKQARKEKARREKTTRQILTGELTQIKVSPRWVRKVDVQA